MFKKCMLLWIAMCAGLAWNCAQALDANPAITDDQCDIDCKCQCRCVYSYCDKKQAQTEIPCRLHKNTSNVKDGLFSRLINLFTLESTDPMPADQKCADALKECLKNCESPDTKDISHSSSVSPEKEILKDVTP